jgi:peptidyl-prolyl cis-trans isomerase SurA
VVNSEPITDLELRAEIQRLAQQLVQQRQQAPSAAQMRQGVLERMINERAQLQAAREMGLRVDEAEVDRTEQAIARQNQIDVGELRKRVAKDGMTVTQFRAQLRDQLLLSRLQEREVESRIRITDGDVERYLQEQQAVQHDPLTQEINLAHILIAVPEKATAEQVTALQERAQRVAQRILSGESFEALVQELSDADRTNGGQLGLRRGDRYPVLFMNAVQKVSDGGVSDVVRSGAGFHVLKVVERRGSTGLARSVVQTRAQHILLRASPTLSQADAVAKLTDLRQRFLRGDAGFAALAREFSQDGSAPQGGDLGWASPGNFVPEFEDAMNKLRDGEVSPPVVTRFGVHLIQVVERRRAELSQKELRDAVRAQLRETRYEEAFANWVQEVRGRAFVEMREPPQ